jgi:hypothetical protein
MTGDPILRRIDKNIQIKFDMKKDKAMKNCIARIIQMTWKNYLRKIAPYGPRKGVLAIERDERRLCVAFYGLGQSIKDTLEERGKAQILAFLIDRAKITNL